MLVEDIMTTDIVAVLPEDTVEKCASILMERNFSGLPVVDEEGYLLGIVTEGDLIRRASQIKGPPALALLGGFIYLDNPKKFIEEIKRAMGEYAGDLMIKKVITIGPQDSIETAATLMVENRINRIPVVDRTGKLIGIISRRDIMNSLYLKDS